LDGHIRPGDDGWVDIGAYESPDEYVSGPGGYADRVLYVRADLPDGRDENGLNWESAFRSISAALDATAGSDEIRVATGEYHEFLCMEPGIRIYGGFAGSETRFDRRLARAEETIIDASGLNTSVVFAARNSTLDGFTITGGSGASGGGIFCYDCSPTLTDLIILRNSAAENGGGIFCCDGSPTLTNLIILTNSAAGNGGGIYCDHAWPTIRNCVVAGNDAGAGGALFTGNDSSPVLVNCTLADNRAGDRSGGMYRGWGWPVLTNCIFWNDGTQINDILDTVTYCCIEGGWPGDGNINRYPEFVDREGGNYRLAKGSPCINSGDAMAAPAFDVDGKRRHWDGKADIGAYEFASVPHTVPGDTDGDSVVDGADLFFFSLWWQQPCNDTNFRCDTVVDDRIDQKDLTQLIKKWK
jgi:hypothetical protein